ncbi:MAG: MFS transporter [Bacteriovoracaceae bacterium]
MKRSLSYLRRQYPGILVLGLISFFMDVASEMLYPITPVFLTTVLGLSTTNLGLIEGVAEGVSSLLKTYSGFLSDKMAKRRPFFFIGYLLSVISKPLIGVSTTYLHVLSARVLDRLGKGLRTSPRDALITDLVKSEDRGFAFGWHRAFDTLGAVTGPLLGLVILKYFADMRMAYFFATIPGLLSVLLIFFIREPKPTAHKSVQNFRFNFKELSHEYKSFIVGWTIFCLTNSSDAFLILKMKQSGLEFSNIILIYAFYNFIYALLSPSLGDLSDRIGTKKVLMFGLLLFTFVYAGFAFANQAYQFVFLFLVYGAFMASTEGVSRAHASRLVPKDSSGTALGIFNTCMGFAQIFASVFAGFLWDQFGPQTALLYSCLGSSILFLKLSFSAPKN